MKPLYNLLSKKKLSWDGACGEAFDWVKNELISPQFLAHYDPREQLILATDACDHGLSAILSHKYKDGSERPIAFASKEIPETELKRAIIDKEAIAIVFGFKKFYQYVFGREIILRTDNKPLELILGPRKGILQLQRCAYFLSGFRYTVEHVKSEKNANADALSRLPVDDPTDLSDVCDPVPAFINFFEERATAFDCGMLEAESRKDETFRRIIRYVTTDWPKFDELTPEERCFYKVRLKLTVEKGCLFWVCVRVFRSLCGVL